MAQKTVTVTGAGSLGLAFIVTDSCMAALAQDPAAEGRVAAENPGVSLEAGDVLQKANGAAFYPVGGCDAKSAGKLNRKDIVKALQATKLRDLYLKTRPDLSATLGNGALADEIRTQYDIDGSGTIDGAERAGFLTLLLSATIQKVGGLSRPLTLVFCHPEHPLVLPQPAKAPPGKSGPPLPARGKSIAVAGGGGAPPPSPPEEDGAPPAGVDFSVTFKAPKMGVSIAVGKTSDGQKVLTVRECSAASEGLAGGVQPGDELCAVNNEVFAEMGKMVKALQSPNRPITVGFKRPGGYRKSRAELAKEKKDSLKRVQSLGMPGFVDGAAIASALPSLPSLPVHAESDGDDDDDDEPAPPPPPTPPGERRISHPEPDPPGVVDVEGGVESDESEGDGADPGPPTGRRNPGRKKDGTFSAPPAPAAAEPFPPLPEVPADGARKKEGREDRPQEGEPGFNPGPPPGGPGPKGGGRRQQAKTATIVPGGAPAVATGGPPPMPPEDALTKMKKKKKKKKKDDDDEESWVYLQPIAIKKMKPAKIKELLKDAGQSYQGNKKDLVARLLAFNAEHAK